MNRRARQNLLAWGRENVRTFPWRDCRDVYKVAVSELMLVRTKPEQVARLWDDFFRRFPTIESLATASEKDIAQALSSLGLQWRARKVAHFAREGLKRFTEGLPSDPSSLRQVPGMGEYVPEATALIVKGHGALPVDTGIARFLNRFCGLNATGELRRKKGVLTAARNLDTPNRELLFTLVDFCAAICTATKPKCGTCPLSRDCAYGRARWKQVSDVTPDDLG